MKREGRQHGMVQRFTRHTSRNINEITTPLTAGLFTKVPSKPTNHSKFTGKVRGHHTSRNINEITSPISAGLFTKVPSKPTNHSKFTGKVRGHAFNPAYKSKDKVKVTQKKRSSGLDVELINNGLLKHFSATACVLYMEEERDHYVDDR